VIKRLLILTIVLSLIVPAFISRTPVLAQEGTWQVGFHLYLLTDFYHGTSVTLDAVKTVTQTPQGRIKSAQYDIDIHGSPSAWIFNATGVLVPEDPDWLSVSRDLNWAGLDATVDLYDSVSNTTMPVEIHAYLWDTSEVYLENGVYMRQARLEGAITHPGRTINLSPAHPYRAEGYIFSTRPLK
jgi:hypothetical protein